MTPDDSSLPLDQDNLKKIKRIERVLNIQLFLIDNYI